MRMAISKANTLRVPLIVAGDLHDTKANLRAECVNRMLETFDLLNQECFILRGNHDAVNEKSQEHALNFLSREAILNDYTGNQTWAITVVPKPNFFNSIGAAGKNRNSVHLVPYHHDTTDLIKYLNKIDIGSVVIMHQGLKKASPGEYGDHDKTAINPINVAGLRIISGHYHTRQTLPIPRGGLWDCIGNPYTLTFGEAKDPEKGFQVLHSDGSLEFIPTNLRKHIIFDMSASDVRPGHVLVYNPEDLLWLKISGTKDALGKLNREIIMAKLNLNAALIKIDLIPSDIISTVSENVTGSLSLTLDNFIDAAEIPAEQKIRLKDLWRAQ